jgi:hypothetical protein
LLIAQVLVRDAGITPLLHQYTMTSMIINYATVTIFRQRKGFQQLFFLNEDYSTKNPWAIKDGNQ